MEHERVKDVSEARIWSFLKGKGLSDFGAAGLMGNLYAESGLKPTNLQNTYALRLKKGEDALKLGRRLVEDYRSVAGPEGGAEKYE